jgi:hypothetical protein
VNFADHGICPNNPIDDCLPAAEPPTPVSLNCVVSNGGVSCEAWPQPVEPGLLTYSWSVSGPVKRQVPQVGTSPLFYGECTDESDASVTVILTSPGYASSTVTTTFACTLGSTEFSP